ncbi:AraC family transcriptional regulator [soil metagenome]
MSIQNIPEIFIPKNKSLPDLLVHDYRMTEDVVKNKANLSVNMFSFLQTGQKHIHFANESVAVNEKQSILIKHGNCLFTELLNHEQVYYCKLFFFSQKVLEDFLIKYKKHFANTYSASKKEAPFFVIANDEYINSFIRSLAAVTRLISSTGQHLLAVKFEEIMLYLASKYGEPFIQYLYALVKSDQHSLLKKTVENNVATALKIEEIAFLCNMSLSTFKRAFTKEYNENPGKWLQKKRLQKARELLQMSKQKPSEIYQDFGYKNLSNFSTAFKNEFGISPREVHSK